MEITSTPIIASFLKITQFTPKGRKRNDLVYMRKCCGMFGGCFRQIEQLNNNFLLGN